MNIIFPLKEREMVYPNIFTTLLQQILSDKLLWIIIDGAKK